MGSRSLRAGALAAALLLLTGLTPDAAFARPSHPGGHHVWSPFPLPATKSVPGHPAGKPGSGHRAMPATRPGHAMSWPTAHTAVVALPGRGDVTGTGLVLSSATAARVSVSVVDHAKVAAAGIDGVLVGVSGAGTTPVKVSLDRSVLATAYGGDYAASLHLVTLPACALTTPSVPSCRTRTPLTGAVTVSSAPLAIAATADSSSPNGSYSATSLKGSDTWSAGGNAGTFTYTVPINVPAALGGTAPGVALSYDSGGVDGETVNANSQASWVGDGWSYTPGFIERSYQSCVDAGHNSADLCWKLDNATLSGGAHAGPLVPAGGSAWKPAQDDGTTVQELTGASNGTGDGSYWLITTPDGTRYFYGAGHLPASVGGTGADPATNSAFTEPVYATAAGQPCYSSAGFSSSWCQQAYRWNLDYVVDPHGNTTVYTYAQETGYYTRAYDGVSGTITPYVRAGDPKSIGYGWRTVDVATGTAKPAALVNFNIVERCMGDPGGCAYADLNSSTAGYWRDTPYYLNCPSSGTCTQYSPSFWSTRMLGSITTQVLVGGAYRNVDSYALAHSWPEPGDGSQASLWLSSVQRTGYDANGVTLSNPPVTFYGVQLANRVPGRTVNGQTLPPMIHWRLQSITDELGSTTTATYSAPTCSQSAPTILPSSPDSNTMLCYPVRWTPVGGAAITDWFNKYLVTAVTVSDSVLATASPAHTVHYQYVGDPAWHANDSEFVKNADRTWDQWRGYRYVITTTGAAPDPVTQVQVTYLRGMDGDLTAAGGTRSVTVTDSQGNSYRDADPLDGTVVETQTYTAAGGAVVHDELTTPYASAPVATHTRPSPLPPLVSVQTDTARTVTRDQIVGGWRTNEIDYTYDPAHGNRPVTRDDKGDGSASAPEICTTTRYATSTANPGLTSYPYEVTTVAGGCATTPGTTTTLSDTIDLFDGNTTAGVLDNSAYGATVADITGQQVVASYNGTTAVYVTTRKGTFDVYGRTLTSTDPNADPLHPTAGVTQTRYTPATGALPVTVTVIDPKAFVTTTTTDPRRAQPTEISDANGRVTDMTYDPLGRLTQVWLPGRAMSAFPASPNEKFSYSLGGGTAPSYTETQALLENGQYTASYVILDGLGQTRQTQTGTLNGGGGRQITDTYYDSHGWTVKTHHAYYNADSLPTATLQVTDDNAVPGSATTAYDGQGRPTAATTYQFATPQAVTTTAYPGADRLDVTPPAGVAPTSTFTDVRGHTTALWRYTTATATGVRTDADVIAYSYDPAGHQTGVVDPNGDSWSYRYDLRGRKTDSQDPDSGHSVTTYDDDNRVTSTMDANGTWNTYTYDILGRKLTQYTGAATPGTGTQVAAWAYDTGIAGAKGQLVTSTTYHGGLAYTQSVVGFTPTMTGGPYTVTGTRTTIPAGTDTTGVSGVYTTAQTFTPNVGLPYVTTLPAAGGLPQENLTAAYNVDDQVVSYGSSTSAITDVAYDPFGRPTRTTLGTEPDQTAVTYDYDDATGRLLTQTFNEESATTPLDTINTYYNTAGQITATADLHGNSDTDLQCYQYDYAGRLATAWTDTGTVTPAAAQYFPNTGACTHPAPTATTAASQIGGPAPYWRTYKYYANGDRQTDTTHDVTGATSNDIRHDYHYATASNLLQSATTTGPSGTSTDNYTYYPNGTTNTRTRASGGNQSFDYDTAGRVTNATTGTAGSSYIYDAEGNPLIQHDPGETVLYLGSQEIHFSTATQTASGIRYITGPGGAQSIETSGGSVTYTFSDPHNTVSLTVDGHTQAVTRRTLDPYGNPRGTGQPSYTVGTWPDEHGFLNKPTDTTTGLTLIGPRQYDPAQGRFLQLDPVLETADLDQIGGYTYSADDPINSSDPTGLTLGTSCSENDACNGGDGCQSIHNAGQRKDCEQDRNADQDLSGGSDGSDGSDLPDNSDPGVTTHTTDAMGMHFTAYVKDGQTVAFSVVQHKSGWEQFWDGIGDGIFTMAGGPACQHAEETGFSMECRQGLAMAVGTAGLGGGGRVPKTELTLNSSLAWEDATWGGRVAYGELDEYGRATGVWATINPDMIGKGTEANHSIFPPGFLGGKKGDARGHLLGAQLGGSGDLEENLVALIQDPVNTPVMRSFENQVRDAVENGKQNVQYSVIPVYNGADPRPIGITMEAFGDNGFQMQVSVLNRK